MANNQPNVDPEIEALKSKVPGLEDEPEAEKPLEEDEPPVSKEETPPKEEEKPEEEAPSDEKVEKPTRPEKYIPIKQYTEEKRKWNETKSEYETRISELEAITKGKDGTKKTDDAIKAYAEKYDADEEQIRELKGALGVRESEPEKPVKISTEDQAVIDKAREITAVQMFDEEYNSLAIPELKTQFPNATPEQLAKAKSEVEKLATTKQYLDKSLDFVVYKNKSAFEKIFASDRKGPESARQAPDKGGSTYTASDFSSGKTPFSTLFELPSEEQGKIVEAMDLKTYEKYTNWINQNDTLAINRGGRKVKY